MKKLLNLIPLGAFLALLFFCQTNMSSCTKNKTITDTVPSVDLKTGLIAYYPFNGNANDSTGKNATATVFGTLQYSSDANNQTGSAALFDGTTNYIVVNDNGNLSPSSITISFQFYENSSAHQNLVSKINISSNALSPAWAIETNGGGIPNPNAAGFVALGSQVPCGSTDDIVPDQLAYSGVSIVPNQWYQLTCTFDQGVERLYLNGVLKGAVSFDYHALKQCMDAQLVIGCWYEQGFLFNGKMDELRIYNRALNDREVQALAKGF